MAPRDEVAVEVHDGLACRLAAIHPHVVAVGRRRVVLLDPSFRQVQNRRQRPLLLRRQAEPVRARAVGDDEQVAVTFLSLQFASACFRHLRRRECTCLVRMH